MVLFQVISYEATITFTFSFKVTAHTKFAQNEGKADPNSPATLLAAQVASSKDHHLARFCKGIMSDMSTLERERRPPPPRPASARPRINQTGTRRRGINQLPRSSLEM